MNEIIIIVILLMILIFIRKRMINYSDIKEINSNNCIFVNESVNEDMYDYSFWNLDESIKMSQKEINEFNERIGISNHIYDLSDGVLYGLVVKTSELRKYPNFDNDGNTIIDKNLLTIIDYGSGLIIIDEKDEWYYVKSKYYEGWILKNNVGLTSKEEMNKYINNKNFVRVIDNKIIIDNQINLRMGVTIPLIKKTNKYMKLLFVDLDHNNNIVYLVKYFKYNKYMIEGNLLFNKKNIVKQALKMINEPYIWGNTDCSSFIQRIFLSFGIFLPRDSMYQSSIQKNNFDIKDILCGDILFVKGHVMLYIGEYNNKKYIIHSVFSDHKKVVLTTIDNYINDIYNYVRL